jgi:hypothetical protein
VFDIGCQILGTHISVWRFERHCLATDGVEGERHARLGLCRRLKIATAGTVENLEAIFAGDWRSPSHEHVQRGPETVDITRWTELIELSVSLFGAHEGRGADGRSHFSRGVPACRLRMQRGLLGFIAVSEISSNPDLGQAPVDDQCFAVFSQHDIAGLQVAVKHSTAVSVSDGVADIDKAAK